MFPCHVSSTEGTSSRMFLAGWSGVLPCPQVGHCCTTCLRGVGWLGYDWRGFQKAPNVEMIHCCRYKLPTSQVGKLDEPGKRRQEQGYLHWKIIEALNCLLTRISYIYICVCVYCNHIYILYMIMCIYIHTHVFTRDTIYSHTFIGWKLPNACHILLVISQLFIIVSCVYVLNAIDSLASWFCLSLVTYVNNILTLLRWWIKTHWHHIHLQWSWWLI